MRTARLLPVSPSMHCSRGMYLPGGVPVQGGWVYLPGGVYLSGGYLPRYPPLWTEWDRYKNITLPKTSFVGGKNETEKPHMHAHTHKPYLLAPARIHARTHSTYLLSSTHQPQYGSCAPRHSPQFWNRLHCCTFTMETWNINKLRTF